MRKEVLQNALRPPWAERAQVFKKCQITPVSEIECCVVSYYGEHAKAKGFKQLTRDALEKEFAGLSRFIEEVDEYLKFRLGSETVGDFVDALRQLGIEVPQVVNEAVARRKNQPHPWDHIGV